MAEKYSSLSNDEKKKVWRAPGSALAKCKSKGDKISRLPDDILVYILSFLDTREALRTCVLARRWKHLWSYVNCFHIDGTKLVCISKRDVHELMPNLDSMLLSFYAARKRFADGVNRVLKQHKRKNIDTFQVTFAGVDEIQKGDIYDWLDFAFKRRVKKLVLNYPHCYEPIRRSWSLTSQFLSGYNLDSLTVLKLSTVKVTGEVMEYILSACPLLELLDVGYTVSLEYLKISGPRLRLKHLSVRHCWSLKNFEICATNLESFVYDGETNVSLRNVPRLVTASFQGPSATAFILNVVSEISPIASQPSFIAVRLCRDSFSSPEFHVRNITQLELFIRKHRCPITKFFSSLLMTCPLLHKFKLKIPEMDACPDCHHSRDCHSLEEVKAPHNCLKQFELGGKVGHQLDIGLAKYILRNALSLEIILISLRGPSMGFFMPYDFHSILIKKDLIGRQLEPLLPAGVILKFWH